MDVKNTKELEDLIKVCVKLGVRELKIGDAHVIFGEPSKATQKPRKAAVKEQQKVETQANLENRKDEIEETIDVAHLEDPLGFEENLAAGMLTNVRTVEDSEDRGIESAL